MLAYKNFNDVIDDLNNCKEEIYKDEEYHWWTGNIDGCRFCGVINSDEYYILLNRLEAILEENTNKEYNN